MVEFSLAILIFLLGVIGVIDVARALFDEHGLTRAAESISHTLTIDYATVPNFPSSQAALVSASSTAVQSAHAQSDTGLNNGTLVGTQYTGYYLLTNSTGAQGNGSVSICFASSRTTPSYLAPDVIKVTVVGAFTPALGAFVGGKTINLSQSSTALTFLGEAESGTYQNACP